ncbi:Pogo transposable element with KRAB domain-like [Oopsacas minuta]|uniref:Pogo transposable element with KRAB domain-like n=1 Tax=Oopsacas minuta TaxID=111878 RepID=A0AAV7JPC5_9METZ|nr:Pogo transposable element with KRAB domain-like [Oopsacas minuta]
MSSNGWMDEKLTHEWLQTVCGGLSFGRRLLVWDSFRCHIQDRVKKEVARLKTDMAVIPGGCTGLIQAPDVSWNKSFKAAYREQYEQWMSEGEKEYTRGGNMKAPTKLLVASWVKKAWEPLSTEIITESFKSCAISNSIDNYKNDKITVIKEDRILFSKRDELVQKLEELTINNGMDDKSENPHELDFEQDELNQIVILDDENLCEEVQDDPYKCTT